MTKDYSIKLAIEATDRFTEPAKKLAAASDALTSKLANNQKALLDFGKQGAAVKRARLLEQRLGKTSTALQTARVATASLGKELARATNPTKKLVNDFERARQKSNRLKQTHREQRDELRSMRNDLREAGVGTRNLAQSYDLLGEKIKQTTSKMERIAKAQAMAGAAAAKYDRALQRGANVSLVAGGLSRVGHGLLNSLRKPLAVAQDLETAMAGVRKVVDFADPDGLGKMKRELIALSGEMPVTAAGLAEIAAAGGRLGIAEEDLGAFTREAAKTAVAFDMTEAEAGDVSAKLGAAWGLDLGQVTRLTDALNHISDSTAATAAETAQSILKIAGPAGEFGLVAEEAAALTSAFIAMGKAPAVAGTATSALLLKLKTATGQAPKFQKALEEIGISAEDLEAEIAHDAKGALVDFLGKVNEVDENDRSGVLLNLFGLEYVDDVAVLAKNLGNLKKHFGLVANEADYLGSKEREFQNQRGTSANRWIEFMNRVNGVQSKIGDALIPLMDKIIDVLDPVLSALQEWAARNPALTGALVAITAGIGGLAVVLAPTITAVSALAIAVALLGKRSAAAKADALVGGAVGGKGKAGKFLKILGGGVATTAALSIGSTLMSDDMTAGDKALSLGEGTAGIAGMWAGGKLGALIGTAIMPGVGTTIGGALGGIVGGIGSSMVASGLANLLFGPSPDDEAVESRKIAEGLADGDKTLSGATPRPSTVTNNHNLDVTIHAAPGMNEMDIAREVTKQLDEAEVQKGVVARSSYLDTVDMYE